MPNPPKVVIVNWTGGQNHFGCRLVSSGYCSLIDDAGMKLIGTIACGQDWKQYRPLLDAADIVLVNGEGSLHHNRHSSLLEIPLHYNASLFNTVWDNMDDHKGIEHFNSIWCRETRSYQALMWVMAKSKRETKIGVFGDIALSAPELIVWAGARSNDLVFTDAVNKRGPKIPPDPYSALRFLSAKQVLTGRFHAGVVCAALGIPVSLYPSNSHKNEGLAVDAGLVCSSTEVEFRIADKEWAARCRSLQRQAFGRLRREFGLTS